MLGEEAGLLADTLIGLNTIDFRYSHSLLLFCDHKGLSGLDVYILYVYSDFIYIFFYHDCKMCFFVQTNLVS